MKRAFDIPAFEWLRPGTVFLALFCGLHQTAPAAEPPADAIIQSFQLLVRSPQDILVLQRGPWWTFRRTVVVVAALATVLALALAWISLLRHRVEIRTRQLQQEVQAHERTEADAEIVVEKHKALMVLVNLIRNARRACDESARPDKRLILRLVANGTERIKLCVG